MHEQVDFPGQSTIKVKWQDRPHFTYPWHFHSEYEILYVIDGFGTSFVADTIETFSSGDLVLLGSNLPHFWRSDESYHAENCQKKVNYIVIQFPNDFFKDPIFQYPEFYLIKKLLKMSLRGIRFFPPFSKKAGKKIIDIVSVTGFERVVLVLELLQYLAESDSYRLLAGELYNQQNYDFTNDRLTKVLHFLNINYQQKIELKKVAEIAHLHPSAFCRFFKEKTGKSLSEFIIDMRIGYACKLLVEGYLTVSQICFECGFNNLSNFNRIFKRQNKCTPKEYKEKFEISVKMN